MTGQSPALRASKLARSPFRPAVEQLEDRTVPGAGGGFTGSGLTGQYFDNTTLTGTPAFTRTDIRLDWAANNSAPGGSIADGFQNVAATDWSAHWTGQLIPAFSETYTFDAYADDALVVKLRPTGSATWTTVINQPQFTHKDTTGSMSLTAGQTYDVDVVFTQLAGVGSATAHWSSPSTPEETIDTLAQSGTSTTPTGPRRSPTSFPAREQLEQGHQR